MHVINIISWNARENLKSYYIEIVMEDMLQEHVYKSKMLGMYNVKKLCWFARELTHINAHVYEMYLCFKSCHCYYLYMSTKCSMCFIFKARQVFPHFLFSVCDHGGALSSIPRSKLLSTRCAPADQLTPLLELLAPLS